MSQSGHNIVSDCVRVARRAARSSRFLWRNYLYAKREHLFGFGSTVEGESDTSAEAPAHAKKDKHDGSSKISSETKKTSWKQADSPPMPADVLSSATTYDSLFRASSAGELDDLGELQNTIMEICTPVMKLVRQVSLDDVGITERWLKEKYSPLKASGNLSWMVPQGGAAATHSGTPEKTVSSAFDIHSNVSSDNRADGDAIIEEASRDELEDIDTLERYIENHIPTLTRRHRNVQHIGYIPIVEEYPKPSLVADSDSDTSESEGNTPHGEPITMGVFILPPGTSIPLHDHPGMCVITKVLYGSLHYRSYDLCTHERRMFPHLRSPSLGDLLPAKPREPLNVAAHEAKVRVREKRENKSKQKVDEDDDDDIPTVEDEEEVDMMRFARFKGGYTIPQGSAVCLTPLRGNIHSLKNYQHSSQAMSSAVHSNEPCVVLDVLFPPYDFHRHRACTYYDELQSASSDNITFLKGIPTPSDLNMDMFDYKGLSPYHPHYDGDDDF